MSENNPLNWGPILEIKRLQLEAAQRAGFSTAHEFLQALAEAREVERLAARETWDSRAKNGDVNKADREYIEACARVDELEGK